MAYLFIHSFIHLFIYLFINSSFTIYEFKTPDLIMLEGVHLRTPQIVICGTRLKIIIIIIINNVTTYFNALRLTSANNCFRFFYELSDLQISKIACAYFF